MPNTKFGNRILDLLPEIELAAIRPSLHPVSFKLRETVYEPDSLIQSIYFPVNCVLSVLTVLANGESVEINTIGLEGLSGSQLVFEAVRSQSEMICQVVGDAQCMRVEDFRRHLEGAVLFRRLIFRYTESMFNFMGQSIACNRLHGVNQRCARWLLLTQDRVGADAFYITQEFLSIMLGTNRPAVTLAASTLQEAGFIEYSRGHLVIRDRAGLEEAACECYAVTAKNFKNALELPELRLENT